MTLTAEKSKAEKTSSMNGEAFSFSFLKFVRLKQVSFWDVKRYLSKKLKSKFDFVKLGELITEENNVIKPAQFPDEEFKILGVNNKIGLFDAYIEKGKNIKQPYQKVENGFIAYNPYRVNVGSIGFKTNEQKNEYISNAYVVFGCNEKLVPEFLYLLFRTEKFNQIIRDNTAGSVRQNLSFNLLEKLEIPLPPIDSEDSTFVTQKTLIENYNAKISQAEVNEKKVEELEKNIEKYLLKELGIEIKEKEQTQWNNFKFLRPVRLKDLSRWSVDFLNNQDNLDEIKNCKYDVVRFEQLITFAQYGISEKSTEAKQGYPMLRMNNIFEGELDLQKLKYVNFPKDKVDSILLKKNDFLFNRTNSKELVGKTAIFDVDGQFIFASYLIRLRINKEKANLYFINYLFNSLVVRKQIDLISRQVLGQANVNLTELKDFLIPLPPLKIQDKIVKHINSEKDKIKLLKSEAEDLRKQAKTEFETALFE